MPAVAKQEKGRQTPLGITSAIFGGGRTIRTRPSMKSKLASGADAEPTNDHAQEAPAENTAAKQNEDKGDGKDKKDEAAKSGNKDKDSDKKAEASSWTEEEDQELIKLKEEGSTWAQITEKLGRPKKDLTQRFGELKRAGSKTGKPAAGQESQRDKQEAKSTQPSSAPKDSDGSGCWESDAEIDPVGSLRQKSQPFEEDSEVKATFESIGSLSMEEAQLLAQLQDFYETQKWIAISGRFHSQTGKHVDPKALKERWRSAPRI